MLLMDAKALAMLDQNGKRGRHRVGILFPGQQRLGSFDRRYCEVFRLARCLELGNCAFTRRCRIGCIERPLKCKQFSPSLDRLGDPGGSRPPIRKRAASGLKAGGRGVVLAQHCEDPVLSAGGHMHEGEWSSRLGIPGQPAEAEELMVMRDLALARLTGARVHFQHLSTSGSVAMVAVDRMCTTSFSR